jgi:DHA1 family bicyclomycin/chloramphenicol resistance-like MFS transporter
VFTAAHRTRVPLAHELRLGGQCNGAVEHCAGHALRPRTFDLDLNTPAARGATTLRLGEFVALAAAMMSTQALAVDAMLPALPTIVRELRVPSANHGQWIVTVYVAGVGIGQLFWGMISDRYGRRPVLLSGLALYVLAAMACALTDSFAALLGWRLLHGLAAASIVVTRSVIRDRYEGRQLARILSLTFVVFLMIPIIAPSLGQLVLIAAPWRSIFGVFAAYAAVVWLWAALRLRETLHPEYRLMLSGAHIAGAVRLVLGNRTSLYYSLAVTAMFGSLLAYIGMVQQIFAETFHRAILMPTMFALCAISMGAASLWNSRFVERIGMRRISHAALLSFIGVTSLHLGVAALGREQLWTFVLLQSATMACFSLAASNFGAMALEPVGAVAGIGASLQGFITTTGGALIGAAIGRQFNGSTLPLVCGALACGLLSLLCVLRAEDGRLFRPHHARGV